MDMDTDTNTDTGMDTGMDTGTDTDTEIRILRRNPNILKNNDQYICFYFSNTMIHSS